MTDVEYHRSRYDIPKQKGFMGVSYPVLIVCLLIVTILFALLLFFLQQSKFKLKEFNYVDEAVKVELVAPVPPPPPPVTLPIEPTKKEDRVEYTGPPVIVPGPPPPPAPPAPARPATITNVSWSRQPRPEFPARAQERGIEEGTVVLLCSVEANGAATNCSIVSETPSGAGFGREALSSMRSARFAPGTVDGVAQGGQARFTVRFRLG